ncbi:MAG: ABC transporter permease subunit [Chthonomonas sp.]|nr:ABC transporter permease subunit [Chthonomonas sp.]
MASEEHYLSPVADLTYRNYDGPLGSVKARWLAIALYQLKRSIKNRFLWVMAVGSGWYYFMMMIIFFFLEQVVGQGGEAGQRQFKEFLARINWRDQFLLGFSYSQLIYFILAWMLGAGAIANDNRSNALLVYLSKPCSKFDYVFGKWMGVFMPLFGLQMLATIFFWLYGGLSFNSYGFMSQAGVVILQMIPVHLMSAALLASVVIGISSLFNQGRVAGSTFAGVYLITNFFTQFVVMTILSQLRDGGSRLANVKPGLFTMYYCSLDGIQIGLAKILLGTDGSPAFGINSRLPNIPIPSTFLMVAAWLVICLIGIGIAWKKVQAVEVV